MRANRSLVVAALALALAVALALVARDFHRFGSEIATSDARFQGGSRSEQLWHTDSLFPAGMTRDVVGGGNDLVYREGVRLFLLGRPRQPGLTYPLAAAYRAGAESALQAAAVGTKDPDLRSRAFNLLGILAIIQAADESADTMGLLKDALAQFRKAVTLDPTSDEAQTNLELVLRLRRQQRARKEAGGRPRQSGKANVVGLGRSGSGY